MWSSVYVLLRLLALKQVSFIKHWKHWEHRLTEFYVCCRESIHEIRRRKRRAMTRRIITTRISRSCDMSQALGDLAVWIVSGCRWHVILQMLALLVLCRVISGFSIWTCCHVRPLLNKFFELKTFMKKPAANLVYVLVVIQNVVLHFLIPKSSWTGFWDRICFVFVPSSNPCSGLFELTLDVLILHSPSCATMSWFVFQIFSGVKNIHELPR